jgi:hypothetical protein
MSANEVKKHIELVQDKMTDYSSTTLNFITAQSEITPRFLSYVNLLLQKYGEFVGEAKAKHFDYLEEIGELDEEIKLYFGQLTMSSEANYSFKLVNLAIGKISEVLSFISGLEGRPPEEKISRQVYEKLVREKDDLEKVVKILVTYKGLPELGELLEKARNIRLMIDENWVLALCSTNLIEAIVNKKLEEYKVSTEGNFENKYFRLVNVIKEKEQRDIQQLMPLALYKGIRNKLDHASHTYRVTPNEAKQISKIVIDLIAEVFR